MWTKQYKRKQTFSIKNYKSMQKTIVNENLIFSLFQSQLSIEFFIPDSFISRYVCYKKNILWKQVNVWGKCLIHVNRKKILTFFCEMFMFLSIRRFQFSDMDKSLDINTKFLCAIWMHQGSSCYLGSISILDICHVCSILFRATMYVMYVCNWCSFLKKIVVSQTTRHVT